MHGVPKMGSSSWFLFAAVLDPGQGSQQVVVLFLFYNKNKTLLIKLPQEDLLEKVSKVSWRQFSCSKVQCCGNRAEHLK